MKKELEEFDSFFTDDYVGKHIALAPCAEAMDKAIVFLIKRIITTRKP